MLSSHHLQWDDTRVRASTYKCRGCFSLHSNPILDPQLVTALFLWWNLTKNDATPDSLPSCWQQSLLWLNCGSLRLWQSPRAALAFLGKPLSCIICLDGTLGTPLYWRLFKHTAVETSCSAVLSQTYSQTFLKSASITIILSLTKFSPVGIAVCLYRKRWFHPQGICAYRGFAITALTLLSFCLTLTLKYFLIKV